MCACCLRVITTRLVEGKNVWHQHNRQAVHDAYMFYSKFNNTKQDGCVRACVRVRGSALL
jgi:hypothetical protein